MTPEEIINVKTILEGLKPEYANGFTDEYIKNIIELCYNIAKNDGFKEDKLYLATAYLVLDILYGIGKEEGSSTVQSKTIEGVSITYATNKYSISRWRTLYEMLLSGKYSTEYSIHYVGIA